MSTPCLHCKTFKKHQWMKFKYLSEDMLTASNWQKNSYLAAVFFSAEEKNMLLRQLRHRQLRHQMSTMTLCYDKKYKTKVKIILHIFVVTEMTSNWQKTRLVQGTVFVSSEKHGHVSTFQSLVNSVIKSERKMTELTNP